MCVPGFRYLLLLATGILCFSCNKGSHLSAEGQKIQDTTMLDQAYGPDAAQRVDVYLPADRSVATTCSMVFIHGGGWTSGDKADFTEAIGVWRKRYPQFAFFNMNYRLASEGGHHFPAQEEDMQLLMAYIQQHSRQFLISTRKVLLGASAGAHMAALQAYKHNDSTDINAIICLYGSYDINALHRDANPYVRILVERLMGAVPEQAPAAYQAASPLNFVTAQSPPTLVMHGAADSIAPVGSARALVASLKAAQVKVAYYEFDYGHGIPPAAAVAAINKMGDFTVEYNR